MSKRLTSESRESEVDSYERERAYEVAHARRQEFEQEEALVVMVVIIGLRVGERRRAYMAGAEAEEDRHVALFSRAQRSVAHACAVRLRAGHQLRRPAETVLVGVQLDERGGVDGAERGPPRRRWRPPPTPPSNSHEIFLIILDHIRRRRRILSLMIGDEHPLRYGTAKGLLLHSMTAHPCRQQRLRRQLLDTPRLLGVHQPLQRIISRSLGGYRGVASAQPRLPLVHVLLPQLLPSFELPLLLHFPQRQFFGVHHPDVDQQ